MKHLITQEYINIITDFCTSYEIEKYTITADGSIDVYGDVNISGSIFESGKIPIDFNMVTGHFWCHHSNLTTLVGSPRVVGKSFQCQHNSLTNLVGSPTKINSIFSCYENQLTSLIGGPKYVNRGYHAYRNQLTSLEGCAEYIGGSLMVNSNPSLNNTYCPSCDIELIGFLERNNTQIPKELTPTLERIILSYQRHFEIWNDDLTLNMDNLNVLLSEIEDGLL